MSSTMKQGEIVEVDSSFCKSYFLDFPSVSLFENLYITYNNGSVYAYKVGEPQVSAWNETFRKTLSVGKAFWAMHLNNKSVKISNG